MEIPEDPPIRLDSTPSGIALVRRGIEAAQILHRKQDVNAGEIVEGVCHLTRALYGPLSYAVLEDANLRTTEDIGRAIYDLDALGVVSPGKGDSIGDFSNLPDLEVTARPHHYPWGEPRVAETAAVPAGRVR